VVIGAKGFSEQYILARLVGHRLEAAGYRVSYREGLGSGVQFAAVKSGNIDVAIDYTGTLWTNELKRDDAPPRDQMLGVLTAWERQQGMRLLGRLGFENAYTFAMRGDRVKALGIASLDDLAARAPGLNFATDPEFLERPEWKAVRRLYAIRFGAANAYSPTFMYRALASGRADVISAYTSDGRIAAERLTVLADPRRAIPNYDAILTLSPRRANDAGVIAALKPLMGRVTVEAMREANYRVDRDDAEKMTPDAAARWLEERIGLQGLPLEGSGLR